MVDLSPARKSYKVIVLKRCYFYLYFPSFSSDYLLTLFFKGEYMLNQFEVRDKYSEVFHFA